MVTGEQGLADEYTGELAAVQRAMGHVLALLSGPGLLASSTSPAQPIPPLQPPHASTVQGVVLCSRPSCFQSLRATQ